MHHLLVTGGAGFIGTNFVRRTLERGAPVLVVDKLTYAGREENLADLVGDPEFRFVRADIADGEAMTKIIEEYRPRAIVNFAAESHVDRSIDGPRPFVETNIVGTFELLEASRRYLQAASAEERGTFRFLHVSTDEVFGSLGPEGAFSETTPYNPRSPYSASKAAADHIVRSYHHTFGLPTLITNCSNNYGPYQLPEKLIPLMILNALRGESLPIYGDGGNVRDWIHVSDHCRGIERVLADAEPGQSYNLGGHAERTNLEVVDSICDALERRRPAAQNAALRARGIASYRDLEIRVEDRPGHDRRYAIDSSRIERDLGWHPEHDFASGLGQTVDWYIGHADWCRSVRADGLDGRRVGLALRAG